MRIWSLLLLLPLLGSCAGAPALPPPATVSKVDFIGELPVTRALAVAIDDRQHIVVVREEGGVALLSSKGETIATLPDKAPDGGRLLKKPSAVACWQDRIYITDRSLDQVVIYSTTGAYLDRFGKGGDDPKEFKSPGGIAVLGGVVYVADTGNGRIQVFGPDGVYLHAFSGRAESKEQSGAARLGEPGAISVDQQGRLLVLDLDDNTIKTYTPDGLFLGRQAGLGKPAALAAAAGGYYMADMASYSIRKYSPERELLLTFGTRGDGRAQFASIAGLAVDIRGRVYVADNKRGLVQIFHPREQLAAEALDQAPPPTVCRWRGSIAASKKVGHGVWDGRGSFYFIDDERIKRHRQGSIDRDFAIKECRPAALAVDQTGALWVLDGRRKRVLKVDGEGKILLSFGVPGAGPGKLADPADLAISNTGIIYVADPGNQWVQIFNVDGIFLNVIRQFKPGVNLVSPRALALAPDNQLYVLDDEHMAVFTFSPQGEGQGRFGRGGKGEAEFDAPVDLLASPDEILVLDRGANRIKFYTPDGTFLRGVGCEGGGKGDMRSAAAITGRDATAFFLSDPENRRVQLLETIHTPQPVAGLTARKEMRAVKLSWNPARESYTGSYTVHRSTGQDSGFTPIATTTGADYTDRKVKPGTTYYYRLTAQSLAGGVSGASRTVSSVPSSYQPPPPQGLVAESLEWSVHLNWQPIDNDFISHYRVYRKEGDIYKLVAKPAAPAYTDSELAPDTPYLYRVTAVSVDEQESSPSLAETRTRIATKPPLGIVVGQLADIFSNTYKIYEKSGMGSVTITNNTGRTITDIHVSFTIKEFMDFPAEQEIAALLPGQSQPLTLKAVFSNRILEVTEDTPVQTEVKATYFENNGRRSFSRSQTVKLYEKHRMMWDVRERFATFITPKDPVLLEFVRNAVTSVRQADNPLLRAATIFAAMGRLGLTYLPDPSNPYQITSEKIDFVDYIQYPRETLERKSGDCDDLVALYSAALESIGMRTKAVEVPGHMLMLFDTGLAAKTDGDSDDELFVVHDQTLWVPVETTLVGSSFTKAWGQGSKTYAKYRDQQLTLLDHRAAWESYKPASLPASPWRAEPLNDKLADSRLTEELRSLNKIWLGVRSRKFEERLATNPNDAEALIQIGIIHGQGGVLDKARQSFIAVLAIDADNVTAINNLGNLYYLDGQFDKAEEQFGRAAQLDPTDPLLLINLAKCQLRSGNKAKAAATFAAARKMEPRITKTHRNLTLELSTALQ